MSEIATSMESAVASWSRPHRRPARVRSYLGAANWFFSQADHRINRKPGSASPSAELVSGAGVGRVDRGRQPANQRSANLDHVFLMSLFPPPLKTYSDLIVGRG
jgi:hypothetical protein